MVLTLPLKTFEGGRPASLSAASEGMWSFCTDSDKSPSAKSPSAKSEKGRRRQTLSNMWSYCSDSEDEALPQTPKAALPSSSLAIKNALPPGHLAVMLDDGDSEEEGMATATSIYQRFDQDWQSAAKMRHRSSAKSTVRHRSTSGRSGVQRRPKFSKRVRTYSEPPLQSCMDSPFTRARGKSANAVLSSCTQGIALARGAKGQTSPRRSPCKSKDVGVHAPDRTAVCRLPAHIQQVVDALPQEMQQHVLKELVRTEQEITHLQSVVHAYEDIHTNGFPQPIDILEARTSSEGHP